MKQVVVSRVIEYIRVCAEEDVPEEVASMLKEIATGNVTPSRQRLFRIEVEDVGEGQDIG